MPIQHRITVLIGIISGVIGVCGALVTLPFMAGNIQGDVAAHGKRLDVQRADIDQLQKDVGCLKVDVKGIQSDMVWVKMNTEKILDLQWKHYKVSSENRQLLIRERGRE